MHRPPEVPSTQARATLNRRSLLSAPLALAPFGVSAQGADAARAPALAPRYYPLRRHPAPLDLRGRLAVVTGASRGIGRAIGEALADRGVEVIGTSRHPAIVPDPPAFPLLSLDVAETASVRDFTAALGRHPAFASRGRLDILINNAGRFVIGRLLPPADSDPAQALAQRDLAARTLYSGHVAVTTALLPLLTSRDYARILFTVSISALYTGASIPNASFIEAYAGAKAALRTYADNLDAWLTASGSPIRVGTVNPYFVRTRGPEHPNPIYTQPVNAQGLSDHDPVFNQTMSFLRQAAANGLPAELVGEACVQLLGAGDQPRHVVVASPRPPLSDQGLNALIEPAILADLQRSAVPLVCRRD